MSEHVNVEPVVLGLGDAPGVAELRDELARRDDVALIAWKPTAADARECLATIDIDAVLLAEDGDTLSLDEIAAIREYTTAPVVVLAAPGAMHVLDEALVEDVADALLLPQAADGVVFAIRKVRQTSVRAHDHAAPHAARTITVFSPKGGTGKSVTASNLAVTIQADGRRALLVDLDLQFGDAAIMLGITPQRTVFELVSAPGEIDPDKLAGYVTRHATGLDLLAAPARPEEADLVAAPRVSALLEAASETYDVVVVDTAPYLGGAMLGALDRTDDLLVVATLDVPTLKDVRQSLQTLELLQFPTERISMVLNRSTAQVGITPAEVEAALDLKFRFALPDDRAVPCAVNRTTPVVLVDRTAPYAQAIAAVARTLTSPRPARAAR